MDSSTSNALGKRITIAMITMNEETAVGTVIKNIKTIAPEAEIIIVDSSQDNTADIAEKSGATVIRQLPPQGYGPAMELALRTGQREVIITMDCDNTYPVEKILELAALVLEKKHDLVNASRLKTKPQAMPWLNYLGNLFFSWIASIVFFKKFTDLHSGMRAYRKSMLDNLQFAAKGAALPVELLIKPFVQGYKLHEIFIDYHERTGKSKMRPFDSAWWTLKRIIKIRMFAR